MFDFNPQTKRLALFFTAFAGGGAERAMLTIADELAARAFPVDVVVTRAEGPLRAELPQGVTLVDLGARRIKHCLVPLVRYLKHTPPAAMLGGISQTNVIAVAAKRIARAPTRLVVFEQTTQTRVAEETGKRRERVMPALMRLAYPRADAIAAVSDGVADDLARSLRIPRARIETIYNPIDNQKVRRLAQAPIEDPWFADGELPVVLGVGRLTLQKDFPTLIRAFGRLRRQVPSRLVILGEGEDRPMLEALVRDLGLEDSVRLPGFELNPYPYMHRAKVFALSSRWEGFGIVIAEALACGTRVVSTDCPNGPREILQDGALGSLVPLSDEVALADALRAAVLDTTPTPPANDRFCPQTITDQIVRLLVP